MSELYEMRMRKDIENRFLLLSFKPFYVYEDNKRTDKIGGFVYDVLPLSDKTVGVKSIKVPGQNIVSQEDLKKKDIIVAFENVTFTPYYSERTGKREISIRAEKVGLAN